MALQDLTPQLRTRLSRMERAVGWFILLATLVLISGFAYYVYHTAKRKGWLIPKASYFIFTDTAAGLKVGDPVTLMGRPVGIITEIELMPADQFDYNVYVAFQLNKPNYGFMWSEGSRGKVTSSLLEQRVLEVSKGTGGYPTYLPYSLKEVTLEEARDLASNENWVLAQEVYGNSETNLVARPLDMLTNLTAIAATGRKQLVVLNRGDEHNSVTAIWNGKQGRYETITSTTKPYWLQVDESVPISERLDKLVVSVQQSMPGVFALTNQISLVLSNSANLTSNLNFVAVSAQPLMANLAVATTNLNHPGSIGELLIPTNINQKLEATLGSADAALTNVNATLTTANTNLAMLAEQLGRSLESLAGMTSNLNAQVQANTNMLSTISKAIVDADDFVQGLKKHWLLRSAFKTQNTNAPAATPARPLRSPKDEGR